MTSGAPTASHSAGQSQGQQRGRIEDVLTEVLIPWAFGQHEEQRIHRRKKSKARDTNSIQILDDITESVHYLADEIVDQAVPLALPHLLDQGGSSGAIKDPRSGKNTFSTLQELESHPLYTLVSSTLQEILLFKANDAAAAAATIVEEIITGMLTPPPDLPAPIRRKHKKGTLRECEICERMMPLTEHHLIPRSEHGKLSRQGKYTLEEMRSRVTMLCRPCHSTVHHMLAAEDLASRYNTIEALLEHEGVRKYGKYASGLKERRFGYEGFGLKSKR